MQSATPSLAKQSQTTGLRPPIISSQACQWQNILVEEFYQPPGEEIYQNATEHTLCLSLNQRPARLFQRIGDRRHNSLFAKGDLSIAPAAALLVSQWAQDDQYLRIRIASQFLAQVAQSEFELYATNVELVPEFRARNPQIEQISLMLLTELRSGGAAGSLYVESLTNVLAVQLIRNYSAAQPRPALVENWLSDYQLLRVTDYICDRLSEPIQLADLAHVLGLSQFHFSRLFKKKTGISPYQYVLQQRVERAKHLLKTTNLSVMEIALRCGFSSHSHLGKWFRSYTGMTPKVFRSQI